MKEMPIGTLVRYSQTHMNRWSRNYMRYRVGIIVGKSKRWSYGEGNWYDVLWMQNDKYPNANNLENYLSRQCLKYFKPKT